ncbi:rep protein, partial [Escherichia coli]|nr:rep protein [Escherichia coli]
MRTCSMWFPVLFRFLAHSLTTLGSWGCGERNHRSQVVGDPVVVRLGVRAQCGSRLFSNFRTVSKRVLAA